MGFFLSFTHPEQLFERDFSISFQVLACFHNDDQSVSSLLDQLHAAVPHFRYVIVAVLPVQAISCYTTIYTSFLIEIQ